MKKLISLMILIFFTFLNTHIIEAKSNQSRMIDNCKRCVDACNQCIDNCITCNDVCSTPPSNTLHEDAYISCTEECKNCIDQCKACIDACNACIKEPINKELMHICMNAYMHECLYGMCQSM